LIDGSNAVLVGSCGSLASLAGLAGLAGFTGFAVNIISFKIFLSVDF
jgi:hypothetical protein